jgi:hypothetical protein
LGCSHRLAGKRQFTQDQLADWAAPSPWARLLRVAVIAAATISGELSACSRRGITDRRFAAEQFQRRFKSFLTSFDELCFLSFLFAQGERCLSVSFQLSQVCASSLK